MSLLNHAFPFDRRLLWVVYYKAKVRSRYFSRSQLPLSVRAEARIAPFGAKSCA